MRERERERETRAFREKNVNLFLLNLNIQYYGDTCPALSSSQNSLERTDSLDFIHFIFIFNQLIQENLAIFLRQLPLEMLLVLLNLLILH